jgi:hypothetical protein
MRVSINGISMAGEKVSYSPEVSASGSFRQRVVAGQYRFGAGSVSVRLGEREFHLPLEPVGERWSVNRDSAEGITQDFVWRTTGPTPYGRSLGLDARNHTHWYGVHIGMSWLVYRSDTRKSTVQPPAGTKLRFFFKAISPTVDGQRLSPFVVEREWDPRGYGGVKDLHDMPPADFEITGIAILPDGSSKPLQFQVGNSPVTPTLQAPLMPYANGKYVGLNASFLID